MSASASEAVKLASGSLSPDIPEKIRGHVDAFDAELGIEGWALDLSVPEESLVLQLLVADTTIAECRTGLRRDDIAAVLDRDIASGFRFPAEIMTALRRTALVQPDASVKVRVAGTPLLLPSLGGPPTLAALFDNRSTDQDLPSGFDLLVRLSALRDRSLGFVERPLRPMPDRAAGFVESFAIDEGGFVWLIGWMRRGAIVDCPAVVLDGQKTPAALAYTLFRRDDIDAEYSGFIGVLLTEWRPSPNSDVHLFVGENGRSYLRTHKSPHIIAVSEFSDQFAQLRPRCHTGHTAALQRMLVRPDSWVLSDHSIGFPVRAALDQVLVLPGLARSSPAGRSARSTRSRGSRYAWAPRSWCRIASRPTSSRVPILPGFSPGANG